MTFYIFPRLAIGVCLLVPFGLMAQEDARSLQSEEREDYYKKWLTEDVVYIITEQERTVFESLTTPEEKEQFIEQFWFRRDPESSTASNEFKMEHYRRIAYANEHFSSGRPGWKTDRGRIYIIHGPPAEIESYPSGGTYEREIHEGGGTTWALPFERWRYRHIEGVSDDIELEFVDFTLTDEYRLVTNPDDKDALFHVPGVGLTLVERMGLADKQDRPYFSHRNDYPMLARRAKDNPFTRYETYAKVKAPLKIKYTDLKELVRVDITYSNLNFEVREDYFKLSRKQVIVPVTLRLENKNMTFEKEGDIYRARIAVYGVVTSLTNRTVAEFEEDMSVSYKSDVFEQALQSYSLYQRILFLDSKMRYKLDLIVKDITSGNIGVAKKAIIPPSYEEGTLATSSLVLSDFIRELVELPKDNEMFVLGDIWIRPSTNRQFSRKTPLVVYFQLYNVAIDRSSLNPFLGVDYKIVRDGEVVKEIRDETGESVQFFSEQRAVLVTRFDLRDFEPGNYRIQIHIRDRISNQTVRLEEDFQIVGLKTTGWK